MLRRAAAIVGVPTAARPHRARPGAAACPTAPAVADDLAGWGPPATAPQVIPVIINSAGELVCGPNRVLFTMVDATGRADRRAGPDRARSRIYDLGRDAAKPIATLDGTFIWAIENERGIYVDQHVLPRGRAATAPSSRPRPRAASP